MQRRSFLVSVVGMLGLPWLRSCKAESQPIAEPWIDTKGVESATVMDAHGGYVVPPEHVPALMEMMRTGKVYHGSTTLKLPLKRMTLEEVCRERGVPYHG